MLIERTFTTADSEPAARDLIGRYLEGQGYRLVATEPDLVYKRGSGLGTWSSFSIKKWQATVTVRTEALPDQTTRVVVSYDINTTGQMVVKREMNAWRQEVDGLLVAAHGMGAEDTPAVRAIGELQQKRSAAEGANWFFWIAGLSIVNSLVYFLGSSWTFLVGLGITQFIDGFAAAIIDEIGPNTVVRLVALALDLAAAGLFVVFGLLARRHKAGFIIGMVVYALDALIFLWVRDYLSFGFHLYALYGLFRGLMAFAQLHKPASGPADGAVVAT